MICGGVHFYPYLTPMRYLKYLLFFLVPVALYLVVTPSPIDPVALEFPRGSFAPGAPLPGIDLVLEETCHGCEDISLNHTGYLYSGSDDGRFLRVSLLDEKAAAEELVKFKGRPLGLEVVGDSLAWVCVEQEGLARVDLRQKTYEILVSAFNDTTFQLIDYLDLDTLGRVYFTDASDKYSDEDLQLDILEGKPNGALYRYDPATKETVRLLDNLHFANGVALSPDQSFLLVNETAGFRVRKYWLTGPKQGQDEIFIEGLLGWPDGISLGDDGLYYLPLISPRTGMHDYILPRPWTRTLVTKLPRALWPAPIRANHILALNASGEIVHNWQDPDPDFSGIASVERVGNTLWFGTLTDRGVGRCLLE